MIYINKIENRITFEIKAGYYPELLSTIISKIQESCIHLFQINCLVNFYIFHQKNLYF